MENKALFTNNLFASPILQYIHSLQPPVIHRDIKPDNIMRRRQDKKLFLIDFGGAKEILGTTVMGSGTIATGMTGEGTILYTPGYAAIEQIKGKAKPVSDIYSLGATCIRLVTGCLPATQTESSPCRRATTINPKITDYSHSAEFCAND